MDEAIKAEIVDVPWPRAHKESEWQIVRHLVNVLSALSAPPQGFPSSLPGRLKHKDCRGLLLKTHVSGASPKFAKPE